MLLYSQPPSFTPFIITFYDLENKNQNRICSRSEDGTPFSNISHQLLVLFHQRSSFFIWSGEIFLQCRDYVKKLLLYGQEKVWENHGDASTNTSPTLEWDISWLAACATDPQSGAGQPHATWPSSAQEMFSPKKNRFTCLQKIGSCASGGITTYYFTIS